MYLLQWACENAPLNGTRHELFTKGDRSVAKWTVLDAGALNAETLRLVAASCMSSQHLERLPAWEDAWCRVDMAPVTVAHVRVSHDTDTCSTQGMRTSGGLKIRPSGPPEPLSRLELRRLFPSVPPRNPSTAVAVGRQFLLAYGTAFSVHHGDDDFDFTDPWFRLRRFRSLFSSSERLTDPVAFLHRLFHRGTKHKRLGPLHAVQRLCFLMEECFGVEVRSWADPGHDASRAWEALPLLVRRPLTVFLDAIRHLLDAYPKARNPLDLPGVILLQDPTGYCGESLLSAWLSFWDRLLPSMQFIAALPAPHHRLVPETLLHKELPIPEASRHPSKPAPKVHGTDVLLIHVDGSLPNVALMKLSRFYKAQGRRVALARGVPLHWSAQEVYASCIFHNPVSLKKVEKLRAFYGEALRVGGTGVDVGCRLPEEIEALPADYALYAELGDRALGFLTRGCPRRCPFCVVPLKEGPPRQVSDLDTLLEGGRRQKLILLDDNLLAHPDADHFLEEMVRRKIMVNFTQSLDIRYVTPSRAAWIRRIRCCNARFTRTNYYFSLNGIENLDLVREKYSLFGFHSRENVEFLVMYGFNTTLAEDVERFRFLRSLPGAYVFVQEYRPFPGSPSPDLDRFFYGDVDRLIMDLIGIEFTQNMKSMEKYYRWVSRRYAMTFGKLHMPLVDAIFRYNDRHLKGRYIQTLAGVKGSVGGEKRPEHPYR
uniref:Elp3/MiaA/NifB-like radical SAM core domain-containing protein n=1 Tax=Desulfacinum infernum TaxID=35837 RepID=A0A832EK74_9BACT